MRKNNSWHNIKSREVVRKLGSDIKKGLTRSQVKEKGKEFGKNSFPSQEKETKWEVFLKQFKSPLIYILIIAGIITLVLEKWTDSIVILIAVLINGVFGFWEENKVSNVLDKLSKKVKSEAVVLRNGRKKEVLREELVPGDIIFLQSGNKVPADARLIEAKNLKVEEAILTGEWVPSLKEEKVLEEDTALADRENMVYLGCLVKSGEAKAVVTNTGKDTKTGEVASLIRSTEERKSPIKRKLSNFAKRIGVIFAVVCVLIFASGILRGGEILEMFEASVAIVVGGIPEGLPIILTVILALGTERILRKKGLMRKLSSVETLGVTQIVCFDKTKTLTEGRMVLAEAKYKEKENTFKAAALCNEAFVENPEAAPEKWEMGASSTDQALVKAGAENGFLKPELEEKYPKVDHLPFSSERKFQLSLRKEEELTLYVSGAPEKVLEKTGASYEWEEKVDELVKKGYRVLAVGYKKLEERPKDLENVKDFNFAGILAFEDPIRREVKDAMKVCKKAGMKPILITGDHEDTALAVASKVGLKTKKGKVLTGKKLDKLSKEEFKGIFQKVDIYARVEPRHKMRIISQWQNQNKVVAMTGDGVNDSPALKKADIGIALGSGTEVAKESSDLILLNDSFSIIVKAIKEGRVILDNLKKGITYVMANSFASVIIVGTATIVFGWPLPILAVQILWNNIIEDSLPNLAFAFEPAEKGIMKRKPADSDRPLLDKRIKTFIFITGILYQALGLVLFWILWNLKGFDLAYVRTMVFGVLVVNTAFVIFGYKNLKKNIVQYNPFSNKVLNLASLLVLGSFCLSIYLGPFQKLLNTVPLGVGSWIILIGISCLSLSLIEITKLIYRKAYGEK